MPPSRSLEYNLARFYQTWPPETPLWESMLPLIGRANLPKATEPSTNGSIAHKNKERFLPFHTQGPLDRDKRHIMDVCAPYRGNSHPIESQRLFVNCLDSLYLASTGLLFICLQKCFSNRKYNNNPPQFQYFPAENFRNSPYVAKS